VIPDSFYVLDGLLHTFMTILQEFGVFEDKIKAELDEQLPLLATSKILMECVKAGMGREAAHQLIKKHSTTERNFFEALASEKEFPLSLNQLKDLIKDPSDFAGMAVEQSRFVAKKIESVTDSKISKVELTQLR
jgi:adenylosuccinate lyase